MSNVSHGTDDCLTRICLIGAWWSKIALKSDFHACQAKLEELWNNMYSPSLVCAINVCLVHLKGMHDLQENIFWKWDRTSGTDLGGGGEGGGCVPHLLFPCTVFKWYSVYQAVLFTIMISSVSELFLISNTFCFVRYTWLTWICRIDGMWRGRGVCSRCSFSCPLFLEFPDSPPETEYLWEHVSLRATAGRMYGWPLKWSKWPSLEKINWNVATTHD